MHEEQHGEAYGSEDTQHAASEPEDSSPDEMLIGIREQPSGEMFAELDELESKVEALIARCEELQRINSGLTQQLAKERELQTGLLEVQSEARKRVDQLIQRLRDLEAQAQ